MRKLKLQVQTTIDGYIAGPNGEMDFMEWNWDDELKKFVGQLTDPVDCIVLGRKLAEGFIPYWAEVAADPNHPEMEAGKKFTETQKLVFSKTLTESKWPNTRVSNADLATEIKQLKKQDGKDMIAYGGAAFVSALLADNLVDELNLLVNPTAIGSGLTIFKNEKGKLDFTLVQSKAFACGIVLLQYAPRTK